MTRKIHLPHNIQLKKYDIMADCNTSIVNPRISMDPRKITCKVCRDYIGVYNKKVHFRPLGHYQFVQHRHAYLAVNNPDKVTCNICRDVLNNNIPDAETTVNLTIRTDDRAVNNKIKAFNRVHNGELTIGDLVELDIFMNLPVNIRVRYNEYSKRAKYMKLKERT